MLVVDVHHWLDEGELPHHDLRLRRRVLRVARFIEYGGPLDVRESRETLMECKRRPGGKQCHGLVWLSRRGVTNDRPPTWFTAYRSTKSACPVPPSAAARNESRPYRHDPACPSRAQRADGSMALSLPLRQRAKHYRGCQ